MKKDQSLRESQNKSHMNTKEDNRNLSLCSADMDTINKAVQEYLENGYSYPLFAPGCGCD